MATARIVFVSVRFWKMPSGACSCVRCTVGYFMRTRGAGVYEIKTNAFVNARVYWSVDTI